MNLKWSDSLLYDLFGNKRAIIEKHQEKNRLRMKIERRSKRYDLHPKTFTSGPLT